MNPDRLKEQEPLPEEEVKVPRRFNWEIKDLVDPIVIRRMTLWRAGLALAVVCGLALAAWVLFFRPPSGQALVGDMVRAAGGMESWHAIDQGQFTRERTLYDESETPVLTEEETFYFRFLENGDYELVIESNTDAGHVVIGRDAEGYWALHDGETVEPESIAQHLGMMCDDEFCTPLCSADMAFYRFSLPFKLTDPGVVPRYAGVAALGGQQVSLLDVTYEQGVGGDRWVFYVDEDSKLVRKIEHYASAEGDAPPQEIYWADYQTQDGITFSQRRTSYRSNGTRLEEYVITEADFKAPIPDEWFMRPDARSVETAALQP